MKKTLRITLLSMLVFLTVSCSGGGTNNDQGIAFSFIGFNGISSDGLCLPTTFIDGYVVPLSFDVATGGAEFPGSGLVGCLNVQNNLSQQGIRVDRVYLDFFVAGADQQPPSTNVAAAMILGPGLSSPGIAPSSLPPAFRGRSNAATIPTNIVPASIMEYLNLNRASFPELPFTMDVQARVSGVTTAGDRIETNVSSAGVRFIPDNRIPGDLVDDGTGGANVDETAADGANTDEEFVDNVAE